MIEVNQEPDGRWGVYIDGVLLGTSKLQCDALQAKYALIRWAEDRETGANVA